ncbi:DUF1801 domain-containing protein [Aquimarina brevivitae]|uniref:Uncharacterized protein DUF1801 n=1 Tax=Aquimarina brevivitae TaxID=323412 RepID=A0A4Q7P1V1_9FLAO|nr:DUF1801 domain-containing protein [Aquimarina brevivitae]RZS93308.1 uncharacterized protein DUF1801 [Aquimarina brevivitae]
MDLLTVITTPEAKQKMNSYPSYVRGRLLELRQLIIDTADACEEIHTIEESLKWGEPSYTTDIGSTLRMDWKSKAPDQFAMYFQCTTKLIPTFKLVYRDLFTYEKNRALLFDLKQRLPATELKSCIKAGLTYHKVKNSPLLGL